MRCSKCGRDNRNGRKFCTTCGTALVASCPKCGGPIEPGESFCGECGTALGEAAPAAAADTAPVRASAGVERRHLTVLFCDLVGSTEIAARLDPEEWREIVADYHRAAAQAIERFGGHVAQYLGDGVMAYFGYPEAHDNDAERAARAGLAILDAISKLNQPSTRPELSARIGIDSGPVVVGASAGKGADVFGDTPNIAARVQAAAEPGTVVITDATHRLVSGLFVVAQFGAQALKGIERPVQLHRVIQLSGVRGRLEAAARTRGLTPFVGREDELRLLMSGWERALDGEGQVALIIGEAGIGKSRLLQRFHEQIGDTPHTWIEAGAGAFFQNTPFYPVTALLRQFLGGNGDKSAEEHHTQLESALVVAGLKPVEAIPLIAPLLNLPLPAKYPTSALPPEQHRRRLLANLVDWVLGAAQVQLLVITIEDLHWADASTLELIQLLVEQGTTSRLLLLYTARPEFRPQWPLRAHHTQITLNPLSARNVREMITQVPARNALAGDIVDIVIERTGGVPLFVEELTRAVLESGTAKLSGREIPVTLRDSLMARLDRLGLAKEVIQIGAVIGSDFSYELLHAVHPIAEQALEAALRTATDAELIYVRDMAATYQFKHALIQDAAYEALLRSRRKELHSRIAEVLMRQFPNRVTSAPELLAHHYTEAGLIPQAIPYWERAGQRASQRSAHAEAISHLTKGLELVKSLPDTPERIQQELTLELALGPSVMANKGHGASEAERVYVRARVLCQRGGENPQLFRVLSGLWAVYMVQGKLQKGRELGEQLLTLAQGLQNPLFLLMAHETLGTALLWLGAFTPARVHLEQGIALYDPSKRRAQGFRAIQDPGVDCLSFTAMALWFLGYPRQALKRISEAVALARQLAHPYSVAYALSHAAIVHQTCREVHAVEEWADAAIAVCTEHGFPFFLALEMVVRGWALAEQGRKEEGLDQIRQGLGLYETTGSGINWPWLYVLLAEVQAKTGEAEDGLRALAEAVAMVDKTGERWWEAELYRLKGQLTLQSGQRPDKSGQSKPRHAGLSRQLATEAELYFRRAIDIARQQSAKSWELRATTCLARLLAQQGRRDESRSMLADIYNWFTEGFDTADLKDAKALLDELAT